MTTDAVLDVDDHGVYDIQFGTNGDILQEDFFDTSLLYSLFGERRAQPNEVVEPRNRRGWIGNSSDFENGSKIWLYQQARLTRENLNGIANEAQVALEWLVQDGFAVSIDQVVAQISGGRVILDITIRRSRSKTDRRFYELWELTGRAN